MEENSTAVDQARINTIVQKSLEKAERALKAANDNLVSGNFEVSMNRCYYATFYAAMATAFSESFLTSKHKQLMGWFNRTFIYEKKLFSAELSRIYKDLYENRQKADYSFDIEYLVSSEDVESSIADAENFVKTIREYLCSPSTK
jgi:uncharacterized protein (UPF0332 family)